MNVLGVKITAHDTGAALISGGRVVAIAEERLNRVKHSPSIFPEKSIQYCLDALSVSSQTLDLIVIDQTGSRQYKNMRAIFEAHTGKIFSGIPIEVINHHDAHAASAFFASPFTESAVLVVDGAGEKIATHIGVHATETETLYRGVGNRLVVIQKTEHVRWKSIFPYLFGIGKLYSLISETYLGFGTYNEGKMMGLAPYGMPEILKRYPIDCWIKEVDGHLVCNAKVRFAGAEDRIKKKQEPWWVSAVRSFFDLIHMPMFELTSPLGYRSVFKPDFFEDIILPRPARGHNDALPDTYYAGIARAAQVIFEEVMVRWGKKLKMITGSENLCVAGGAGLNIDANKRFLDDVGFTGLFVQPAASDSGVALGSALWGYHMILKQPRIFEMRSASLGRTYSDEEIISALKEKESDIIWEKSSEVAVKTAGFIAAGKIIGWFHGGSEYGPRALGNRSILCDARNPKMKDIVNEKVKHREPWRPFAASILAERQREWFALDHPSPFMLLAAPVLAGKREKVPSIVHVDGTCRIQSVTKDANARYHELLAAFEKETGVPLVLNTSFNDAGEPIVETPRDALRCFLKTNMDVLVLEDYIVKKRAV